MSDLGELGRVLIMLGVVLLALGLLTLGGRLPGVGRLPGDLVFRRGNFTFYLPLASSLLLSLLLTLVVFLFRRG